MSSADIVHICCQGASMPCCSSLEQLLWQLWSCIFFKCRILVVQSNVTSRATHRANNRQTTDMQDRQVFIKMNFGSKLNQTVAPNFKTLNLKLWHDMPDLMIIMCKLGQFWALKRMWLKIKAGCSTGRCWADARGMFHPQADAGKLKAPFSVYLECGFITATIFLVLSSSGASFIIA